MPLCTCLTAIFFTVQACIIQQSGHHIVESQLMVVDRTGGDTRSFSNERNTYTTFVRGTLRAFQQAVTIEPCRICTALLMRSIIRSEDNEGILIEALLLQLVKYLAYLRIQTVYHCGKLCMTCIVAIIPRAEVTTIRTILSLKTFGIFCHQTIIGLP